MAQLLDINNLHIIEEKKRNSYRCEITKRTVSFGR